MGSTHRVDPFLFVLCLLWGMFIDEPPLFLVMIVTL